MFVYERDTQAKQANLICLYVILLHPMLIKHLTITERWLVTQVEQVSVLVCLCFSVSSSLRAAGPCAEFVNNNTGVLVV